MQRKQPRRGVWLACLLASLIPAIAAAGEPTYSPGQLTDVRAKLDGISERLARIETKLDVAVEMAREQQVTLHGPPADGERPGLIGRVQAVEGYQRTHAWAIGAIGMAMIGGVVGLGRQAVARRLWPRDVRRSKPYIHGTDRGPP